MTRANYQTSLITVRVKDSMLESLRRIDINMSQVVRQALQHYIDVKEVDRDRIAWDRALEGTL